MSDFDRAFERLREANPELVRPIEDRPTAREMLASVHGHVRPQSARRWSRGLLVAAAAAIVVLVIALPALVFQLGDSDAPPTDTRPTVSTTLPPTTTSTIPQTTSTSTTTSTTVPVLDPDTQRLIDTFVDVYNAGDVEALVALLHPDFRREIGTGQVRPLETFVALYEVDVALNTEISVMCGPAAADAACTPSRFDDLHRVLGIAPTTEAMWFLTFEDGLLRTWSEQSQPLGPTPYSLAVVDAFSEWVVANSPDVADATDFEQRFFSGGTGAWVPRPGVADDLAALVAEWAADLGVSLDE